MSETLKIATWNINGLRARLPLLLEWLAAARPDVVMLQEIKMATEAVPLEPLEEAGYSVYALGQKTWHGVALLSRTPLDDVTTGLPCGEQAPACMAEPRYIQGLCKGWMVASVYVPNGQTPESPKFQDKLVFLEHLARQMGRLVAQGEKVIVGGDFNVAPTDDDVHDPDMWRDQILCTPPERAAFRTLLDTGYTDAWRSLNPGVKTWSWWDYRAGAFRRNQGLRIDHLLVSHPEALEEVGIDASPRALARPSDHTPVWSVVRVF